MDFAGQAVQKDVKLQLSRGGSSIEARIYTGKSISADRPTLRVAVVSHPYGPLGGSFDDPTVLLTVDTLLNTGYDIVGTFNFRRPSWTLKSEIADFSNYSLFLMLYGCLLSNTTLQSIHLLAAGYSYGSLVASQAPSAAGMFARGTGDGDFVLEQARALTIDQVGSPTASAKTADSLLADADLSTSYLLISPLLSPTTNLVAPFNRKASLVGRIDNDRETRPALAVFGNDDAFTSSRRLEAWASDNGIEYKVIKGAGHFWQTSKHRVQLANAISEWASLLPHPVKESLG